MCELGVWKAAVMVHIACSQASNDELHIIQVL